MASHYFLNEITNHIGDSSVLVTALLNQVSTYADAEVEWYVRPDQQQFLGADSSVFVEPNHADLATRLKNRVVQLSQNGAAGSIFHVFSYDGYVLGAATALNGPDLSVIGHHLAELTRAKGRGPQPVGLRSPISQRDRALTELSLIGAISLAKRVLLEGAHTSRENALHQKDLRPRMMRVDERARKNPYNPGSVGLIKQLVRIGVTEGWLRQESRGNGQTGYEFIWLVPDYHPAERPQGPPPVIEQTAVTPVASMTSPKTTGNGFATTPQPDSPTLGIRRAEPNGMEHPQATGQQPEPVLQKGSSKYSRSLSRQMEDLVRNQHIGTPSAYTAVSI